MRRHSPSTLRLVQLLRAYAGAKYHEDVAMVELLAQELLSHAQQGQVRAVFAGRQGRGAPYLTRN